MARHSAAAVVIRSLLLMTTVLQFKTARESSNANHSTRQSRSNLQRRCSTSCSVTALVKAMRTTKTIRCRQVAMTTSDSSSSTLSQAGLPVSMAIRPCSSACSCSSPQRLTSHLESLMVDSTAAVLMTCYSIASSKPLQSVR